ncbi:MAG: hypothetical protein COC12_13380 [Rhodobacteraceae bacterium]|nr:MAG: hypothetical protein COC12_13380 [Paracoccaceae bacterium]
MTVRTNVDAMPKDFYRPGLANRNPVIKCPISPRIGKVQIDAPVIANRIAIKNNVENLPVKLNGMKTGADQVYLFIDSQSVVIRD